MQKMPLSMDQVFLSDAHDKRVTQATDPAVPANTTQNGTGPNVTTATTSTDSCSTTVRHISDDVDVSPSERSELPMTCAKLASSEGTTICCNGKECQVTINPPAEVPPPKKCCSAIVPKKRTRHMQEHDSEDMEQCALETLASFRGCYLLSQKSRSCQKKATRRVSRSSRKSKDKCIMRCEREVVCMEKNSGICKEEEEEGRDEEEDHSEIHTHSDSHQETEISKRKIEIYNIEKDSVLSRKTVIVNSGVTVTLEPTETATSRDKQGDQIQCVTQAPAFASENQNQNVPKSDASRESAQILAELMFHTSPHLNQAASGLMSAKDLTTNIPASLNSLAEVQVNYPADSSLLTPNVTFSSSGCVSFGDTFSSVDINSNIPNPSDMNANVPVSKSLGQMTVSPQMDVHQLHDLDALTSSIRFFDSLDSVSNDSSTLAVSDISFPLNSGTCSLGQNDGSAEEKEKRKQAAGKKRRYPTSRPYKCGQCDQAFNQPIHLKKHMSKHTGNTSHCVSGCNNMVLW